MEPTRGAIQVALGESVATDDHNAARAALKARAPADAALVVIDDWTVAGGAAGLVRRDNAQAVLRRLLSHLTLGAPLAACVRLGPRAFGVLTFAVKTHPLRGYTTQHAAPSLPAPRAIELAMAFAGDQLWLDARSPEQGLLLYYFLPVPAAYKPQMALRRSVLKLVAVDDARREVDADAPDESAPPTTFHVLHGAWQPPIDVHPLSTDYSRPTCHMPDSYVRYFYARDSKDHAGRLAVALLYFGGKRTSDLSHEHGVVEDALGGSATAIMAYLPAMQNVVGFLEDRPPGDDYPRLSFFVHCRMFDRLDPWKDGWLDALARVLDSRTAAAPGGADKKLDPETLMRCICWAALGWRGPEDGHAQHRHVAVARSEDALALVAYEMAHAGAAPPDDEAAAVQARRAHERELDMLDQNLRAPVSRRPPKPGA